MHRFAIFIVFFLSCIIAQAQEPVTVKIDAAKPGEMISPYIYGQFIEHLGRCINGGGIWAEVLEDRKFFYPIGPVNDDEAAWTRYNASGKVEMDKENPFVGEHSPKITLAGGGQVGIEQHLRLRDRVQHKGYIWLKCSEGVEEARIIITYPKALATTALPIVGIDIPVKIGDYYRHDFEFIAPTKVCTMELLFRGTGTVRIGCVSLMPGDNVHGMRADTLELLKRLDSPIYRWPGGNFVSGYDWRDGIGDRDRRPSRKNPAWKGVEPNDFGVDEFLLFCKLLNTEPYIAVNTGDGDVANALAELEYVNGAADTPMGKLRAEHGRREPYGVIWWGIGNEMYGNWQIGHMPVEKYVEKNNAFVDAFRKADPKVKCIAVGHVGKWDEAFLPGAAKHMDLISEHFYVRDKPNVAEHVRQVPNSIKRIADAHRKYRQTLPNFKDVAVPIALDEWNYWYGDHVFGELGTRYFVKDGLGVAAGIHEFARQADMYFMANYAQTVNVIGCIKTSKTAAKMETTGLALELYRKHFGKIPVKTVCENPVLDVQAALLEKGGISVGIVNSSEKPQTVKLDMAGFGGVGVGGAGVPAKLFVIADPQNDPMGFNDPDKPYRIEIVESTVEKFGGTVTVKPYSVTLLKFEP